MSRRKTHKEFIEEIKAVNGGKYEVISEYKFAREKVRLKCCTCGKVWENTPTHLLRGQACPYCSGKNKTNDIFLEQVHERFCGGYDILEKYSNAKTKIEVLNKKCGHKYKISPDNLLRGKGCPECRQNKLKEQRTHKSKDIQSKVNKTLGDEYDYIGGYKNSKGNITIKHKKCGNTYQICYGTLRQGGGYCECEKRAISLKKLDEISLTKTDDRISCKTDFQRFIDKNCHDEYVVIGEYIKSIEPILVKHKLCNGTFWVTPHNFKNGVRCKKCNEYRGERRVKEFLLSKGVFFEEQVRFDDCRYKKPLPFDFYLPTMNTLIEFDGEQHDRPVDRWGGVEAFKIQKKRDEIKNNYCKSKSITLIRIKYYDDIETKLEQLF